MEKEWLVRACFEVVGKLLADWLESGLPRFWEDFSVARPFGAQS
jgi:hypothetical protein